MQESRAGVGDEDLNQVSLRGGFKADNILVFAGGCDGLVFDHFNGVLEAVSTA